MTDECTDEPRSPEQTAQRVAEIKQRVEELADLDYPPIETLDGRECDLVMKGGITSGIVYPLAACELARKYRFRSIGGSSAGAIGAVMVAAAEKGRATGGYRKLAAIPTELGPDLGSIFTPGPHTETALTALKGWLTPGESKSSRIRRVLQTLRGAQRARFWTAFALVLAIGIGGSLVAAGLPADGGDWVQLGIVTLLLTLPVAFGVALLVALVAEARSTLNNLDAQGFGLCIGSDGPNADERTRCGPGPFTDWMATKIDQVAGVSGPLTIGDLWGQNPEKPELELRVMTTNLTQGRPQTFPFKPRTYLFDEQELAAYFPPSVMNLLMKDQKPATTDQGPLMAVEPPPKKEPGPPPKPSLGRRLLTPLRWLFGADRPRQAPASKPRPLYWLPPPEKLPVVLAARLSLSFPGLISAVPLWAVDEKIKVDTPNSTGYGARRCWMTDGGLTANFPVHFFDSMLPSRPTFAIDLQSYPDECPKQDVYYPGASTSGVQPKFKTITSVQGFATGLLDTMQYWADNAQAALPGYSDRIVEVRLAAGEGGMNLKMPADVVRRVAEKGRQAAEELKTSFDFDTHRWIRYLTVLGRMQVAVDKMDERWKPALSSREIGYHDFVLRRAGELFKRTDTWRQDAVRRTDLLIAFGTVLSRTPDFLAEAPKPDPDMRITPQF